jgi:long-chain acyl-CoA synthetase
MFESFKKNKNRIALIDSDKNISYGELINISKKLPLNKKKNLVLILAENKIEPIAVYASLISKRQACFLIDSKIDSYLLKNLIDKYRPNMIFGHKNNIIKFKNYRKVYKINNYVLVEAKTLTNYKIHRDIVLLLSTSGSTASPKYVKISWKALKNNTAQIQKVLKINKDHKTITTLPFHYTYGLSIINTHLDKGCSIVINNNKIFENTFWNKIQKFSVNSFGGVAYMYQLMKRINIKKKFFKTIKYLTHAGGHLDLGTWNYILGITGIKKKFYNMYGAVEACSRISILDYKHVFTKKNSIGKGLPGVKIFIKKKRNKGELFFSGKNIFSGYANSYKDLSSLKIYKQYNTKDLAYKDKDGYYYIIGRKDRYIKILSNRIYLNDLENYFSNNYTKLVCIGKNNQLFLFANLNYRAKIIRVCNEKFNIHSNYINFYSFAHVKYMRNNKIDYNYLKNNFIK